MVNGVKEGLVNDCQDAGNGEIRHLRVWAYEIIFHWYEPCCRWAGVMSFCSTVPSELPYGHGAPAIHYITLPAGVFRMGGVVEDKFVSTVEMPGREVAIRAFEMSVYTITRGQWAESLSRKVEHDELPVTGVSFHEACAFAARHGARLPSEAEWEYACRAGSRTIFPQGARLESSDANFLYDESGIQVGPGMPTPVGCHAPNAFGLHDMLGNVCEWTADLWHAGYEKAPCDGSAWIDGGKPGCRVIRGGAWDHLPRLLRASWRDWAPESARWDNLGFRLARDLKP